MKNKILITLSVLFCVSVNSQVGIETEYPKGILHVDGNKDNPKNATETLTTVQQANDFVVQQGSGNVGLGTITPTTKLEINNGTTNGAIKIKDGNQGSGKYLMSDNNGLATWITPNSFKSPVIWTYNGTPQHVSIIGELDSSTGWYLQSSNRTYVNLSLTGLTTGKWIVNIGLRLATSAPINKAFWIHANLSSSSTTRSNAGWANLGPAGNATGYASVIFGDGTVNGKGFFTGTSIINVTSTTPLTLYLLLENTGQWEFDTSSPENYFFAVPVN